VPPVQIRDVKTLSPVSTLGNAVLLYTVFVVLFVGFRD
jgi:hypothetical protein